jgi:hypothetical protein
LGQLLSSDQRDFEGGGAIAYAGSGLTLSRETVAPLIGAQSLKAVSTVNGLAFLWPTSGVDAYFTVPVGVRTFKVTLAVLAPAGRAMQLWVRRFHPGLATYDDAVTSFTGTGEIQWVSGEIDTLSDTPAVQFYLLDFASTIGSEYWFDGAFFSDSDEVATGTLEIAFASEPLAESPTWESVTADLQRVSFSRGRSSALSRWEAGQGSVLLENLERQYEPFYAAGSNYPNVLPRKRVRFQTANGTPVFEAFASGFYPTYESLDYATCSVPLADGFKVLGESLLKAAYDREVLADSPVFYYKLNETSGEVAFDSSGNGRHGRFYGAGIEFEHTWPESAHENSATYFPSLPDEGHLRAATTNVAATFTYEFNILARAVTVSERFFTTDHRGVFDGSAPTPLYVVAQVDAGGKIDVAVADDLNEMEVSPPNVITGTGWHHFAIVVSASESTLKVYLDGVLVGTDAGALTALDPTLSVIPVIAMPYHPGADLTVKWSGFMGPVAYYDSALSAGRVAAHYAAVRAGYGELTGERVTEVLDQAEWPASRRDVETGQIQMASNYDAETQNALIAIKQAEETEGGHAFISRSGDLTFLDHYAALITHPRSMTSQATFGNEEGEHNPSSLVLAIDTDDTANVIRVTHQDGSVAEVRDETSVAKYGALAVDERSAALTSAEAKGQAEWELLRLKDPQAMRIRSMTFELFRSNVDQLCSLELMDRVTARWTPPGGGARIDQEALISKITHDINADPATWKMTIEMMPLGLATDQFWRWGTSTWEGADTRFGWGVG